MNLMDLVATLKMDVSQFISGAKQSQQAMSDIEAATGRLSNSLKSAGAGDIDALNEAFKTLKVQGSNQLRELDAAATTAFLEIKHSGIASATDIANAEAAQMEIRRKHYQSLGIDVGKTTEEIKAMNNEALSSAAKLGALGAGLSVALTKPIADLVQSSIGMSEQFRQAEVALTTMIGSGTKAQAFLSELKTFAASTPFEFPDLLNAAQRMKALGFDAEAVIPIMRGIGNAVADLGGGQEKINRITLALGQMQTAGKVNAQDMRQLTEAGINAWQALADKIGVSVPQAMEMARKGIISSAEAIPAILEGMQKQFGDSMDAQMKTLTGRWSNIKDQISFVLADIGKALTPLAETALSVVEPIVNGVRSAVEAFTNLSPPVKGVIEAVVAFAAAVGPVIAAVAAWQGGIALLATALGTEAAAGLGGIIVALAPELATLAGVIAAVWAAWELWQLEPVQQAVASIGETLGSLWQNILVPMAEFITGTVIVGWEKLKENWESVAVVLGVALLPILAPIAAGVAAVWAAWQVWNIKPIHDALVDFGNYIGKGLTEALGWVSDKLKEAWTWFSQLSGVKKIMDEGKAAVESFGSSTKSSMETVRDALATAKKNLDDVNEAFKNKKATEQDVKQASEQLAAVQRIYNDELSKTQPALKAATDALKSARDEQDRAQASVNKYRLELASGKDVAGQYARAQSDLERAQKNVADATSKVQKITNEAGITFKEYDGGIEAVRKSLQSHRTAVDDAAASTKELNNVTKLLHESDTLYASLVKSSLTPAHISLRQALINEKQAKEDLKNATNSMIEADSNLRDVASQASVTSEQLKEAEQKLSDAQAIAKNAASAHSEAMKALHAAQQDAKQSAKELDDQFNALQKTMANWSKSEAPATTQAIKDILSSVQTLNSTIDETAQTKAYAAQLALKNMGIKPKEDLDALAAQSRHDFDIVTNSGTSSATEITKAWIKMMEDRKAALKANGQDLSDQEQANLDAMKAKIENKPNIADKWSDMNAAIHQSTAKLGQDMVDILFEGPGSFADKAIESLKNIGKAVLDHFVQPAMTAIGNFISTTLADLLSGKGFGGVLDGIKNIGKAVSDIFGGGSSVASAAGGAASVGGGIASSAGGTASAAIGASMQGIMGMITGAISAVTGVISVFQNMHQETSLNAIEHNTRYSMMFLGEQGWDSIHGNTHDSKLILDEIKGHLIGNQMSILNTISDTLTTKLGNIFDEAVNVKNATINVKDYLADLIHKIGDGDVNGKLGDINTILVTISGSLDEIKVNTGTVKDNTAATGPLSTSKLEGALSDINTNVVQALKDVGTDIGTLGNNISTAFNSSVGGLSAPLSNIQNAVSRIDFVTPLNTAMSNLRTSLASDINSPGGAIWTGFYNLSQQINGMNNNLMTLPSTLANIRSSVNNTTTNSTTVYLNINNTPQGIVNDLGTRLRSYGIVV